MDLITIGNLIKLPAVSISPITTNIFSHGLSLKTHNNNNNDNKSSFSLWTNTIFAIPNNSCIVHAKKRNSKPEQPVVKPTITQEVLMDNNQEDQEEEEEEEQQQLLLDDDDFEDEALVDGDDVDDSFEDEYLEDEPEPQFGDGAAGGGIALAGMWWDKEALRIAEEVCLSFDGELKMYAFKTTANSTIQVRIERLTNRSGSPNMEDIEAFSTTYRARLNEAELAKTVTDSIALEVSSPGVERVVRIPEDLDRFKERPMYVKYVSEIVATDTSSESDGVFRLISFDMETKCCTWGLANVKINREKAGKGRPLSKKQREWRLNTPFHSLRLVRLYSEI